MDSLSRDGVRLAFEDVGRGAPPILLIHDLGRDHRHLRSQRDHFRRQHRVVAVDLRGHGHSDSLVHPYAPTDFAEDLAWLCYELGVYRPVAVGQGASGLIVMHLAVHQPDLLAAVVLLEAPGSLPTVAVWSSGLPAGRDVATCSSEEAAHLVPINKHAMARGRVAGLAHCALPVLYVRFGRSVGDLQSLRVVCPRLTLGVVGPPSLQCGGVADQVNAFIESFLTATML